MSQVFAHLDCPASAFICPELGLTPLWTWADPIVVRYTLAGGGAPPNDTILPRTAARTLALAATFDRTTDDWVVIILVGSASLRVIRMADVESLDELVTESDYGLLVWVRGNDLVLFQQA